MSIVASIATANPEFKHDQKAILDYMIRVLQSPEDERKLLSILYHRSGIKSRYSVLSEFSKNATLSFFHQNGKPQPLEGRMALYHEQAGQLSIKAIERCLDGKCTPDEITHLITVSCTGLAAPGLDIELTENLKMKSTIYRTSVNFMGCYAALHAFKQADMICKTEQNAKVLVVSVELCTIHFQNRNDMDNLTANLLFGDGAAAALVCSDKMASEKGWKGLQIKNFHSDIRFNGKKDMAWKISSTGFLMTLSNYIPDLVEAGICELVTASLKTTGNSPSTIHHWAIHPGGRRILEVIEKELKLNKNLLESSYNVLRDYGNMSSPTVLFVMKDIWNNKIDWNKDELMFAAGFGPGLTMESMVFEVKRMCE
ncbi:type III polyketide synthase [Solitalea koreensis]|uniref:Predicted naringenin-chalcone synthase n=1 Tax=Solitalea koreensis TaxID=543615 RepID=A0A521AS73_9SPHI|nr:type III polyketide synthase [Solitalea koreensis]SMO37636.1 Predicted naringenin-chalcone synthase [Solitalea koreensis]